MGRLLFALLAVLAAVAIFLAVRFGADGLPPPTGKEGYGGPPGASASLPARLHVPVATRPGDDSLVNQAWRHTRFRDDVFRGVPATVAHAYSQAPSPWKNFEKPDNIMTYDMEGGQLGDSPANIDLAGVVEPQLWPPADGRATLPDPPGGGASLPPPLPPSLVPPEVSTYGYASGTDGTSNSISPAPTQKSGPYRRGQTRTASGGRYGMTRS